MEQLHAADLELFKVLMSQTRAGIRPSVSGDRPLEDAIRRAGESAEVRLYLQPLPGKDGGSGGKRKRDDGDNSEIDRLRKQVANLEGRLKNASSSSKGDSGPRPSRGSARATRGQRKGKSDFKMPKELEGLQATGSDGQPRCFGFNLDGCKGAKPGGRCNRGVHACMKCGKPHSQRDCK